LECSLLGHEGAIHYAPGSLVQGAMGVERSIERYSCSYGIDRPYVARLAEHGVRFTAHDDAGDVRVLELPEHPFFLATLFQPELAGDGTRAHPIVRAFADAAANYAGRSCGITADDHLSHERSAINSQSRARAREVSDGAPSPPKS